ncbi:MAG: response regulator [Kangiellaceae bacterium]|jgi:excisionase family DNA binding protein|nr:response regulator [Kangiellaceae bacterium]
MGNNKSYYTPKEVAELLMVSTSAVRQWSEKGELKAMITAGGHRRFRPTDIEAFARQKGITLNLPGSEQQKVLIIDDDELFCELLTDFFASIENVTTQICQSGFEAGLALRQFKPEAVILDLYMPGIDGFNVCQLIKQDPALASIKVIAVSGDASDENRQKIMNLGAEACLEKPLSMDKLLKLLNIEP